MVWEMNAFFHPDGSYIPLFGQPPLPFAHNRPNSLLGCLIFRAPPIRPPCPLHAAGVAHGGGGDW